MKKTIAVLSVVLFAGVLCRAVAQDKSDGNKAEQSINALISELAKDGTFSKADAESVALEVARRLWWPESNKTAVVSTDEKDGKWTVRVQNRIGTPADPGCQVIVSKHWLVSATFLPGR